MPFRLKPLQPQQPQLQQRLPYADDMGSVGRDYRCPWCGRTGFGGYAPDRVGYPICTRGRFSCLWFNYDALRIFTMQEIRRLQLQAIFGTTQHADVILVILDPLAAFLSSPPTSPPGPHGPHVPPLHVAASLLALLTTLLTTGAPRPVAV